MSNFNQYASINILKFALRNSNVSEEVKGKYKKYEEDPEELDRTPVRCWDLYKDLEPGYSFMAELGLNTARPYTLASWDSE